MSRIQAFDRGLELDVRNTMPEYRVQALLSQFRACARVTEIVRYQVEALRLRGAVPGEVDDNCIFRLRAFQCIERSGFQSGWTRLARESLNCGEYGCLRRVLIE